MKHSDYLKKKKTRETRKKIISVISAIVVFITTYALVLPAITLDVSKASQEPGIAYEQMQFRATAAAASVTAADSTVEEAQVEEPAAEEPEEEPAEVIEEEPAETPEEETSAVSAEEEPEEEPAEEAPAEPEQEEAPAEEPAETAEPQEEKSEADQSAAESSSESAPAEAETADTQKAAEDAAVDQSGTAATDAAAAATTAEAAAEFKVPELDALDFDDILTGKTNFYYYHVENAEEAEELSSDSIDDWKKVNSDTVLAPEDFVRVYLSYEIPAGALNETNAVARYTLPAGLELSDKQIKAINKYENGIAASMSGSDQEKYLGAEAIEGSRTPDEKADDEYIAATVKVKKTDNDRQELVFTFIPYTVEKNQISYDEKGEVKSKGKEVKGFFTFDLTTSQIDFEETNTETVDKEDGTTEEIQYGQADVVFVKENKDKNIDEISRTLVMSAPAENEEPQIQEQKTLIKEGDDYTVTVSYTDEAQIPDNATLEVSEIGKATPEYASYLEQAKGAVDDETKSVNEARFFDITILADGEKVEPQAPVNVQITFAGIEQTNTDDAQLLHYKDNEDVEIMDKAEFSKSEEQTVDTVQFETEGFSVYGIVGTETLTTNYITAEGDTYTITVTYGKDAEIPEGAILEVSELANDNKEYTDYVEQAAKALAEGEEVPFVNAARLFDISIMADGKKVEPKAPVEVKIEYANAENLNETSEVGAVHFKESTFKTETEVMDVNVQGEEGKVDGVTFTTDSFSIYAVVIIDKEAGTFVFEDDNYKVTVTYTKDANIPIGTELTVMEIDSEEDQYWDLRKQLIEKINEGVERTNLDEPDPRKGITDAVFFDVSLNYEGKEIEPDVPLEVQIEYKKSGIVVPEGESTGVVHFGKETTEIIKDIETEVVDIEPEKAGLVTSYKYEQSGFSPIGNYSTGEYIEITSIDNTSVRALAAPPTRASSITASKDITDEDGDGVYELALSVTGQSESSSQTNVDKSNVVIVIDVSGSMDEDVYSEYTYSASTYDSNTKYYGYRNNNYIQVWRNGNNWYRTRNVDWWGNVTYSNQYNDTVYTQTTRLEATKAAASALVDALLANNKDQTQDGVSLRDIIEISLVKFANNTATTRYNGTETLISKSTNATALKNAINGLTAGGGTNWEMALQQAKSEADVYKDQTGETTSVIFLTDGKPTLRGSGDNGDGLEGDNNVQSCWNAASDDARTIITSGYNLYNIFAFGTDSGTNSGSNYLKALTNYAYTGSGTYSSYGDQTYTDGTSTSDYFYNATSTQALIDAFQKIIDKINKAVGYGGITVDDGVTTGVTNTSVTVDGSVNTSSFKYSIHSGENTLVTVHIEGNTATFKSGTSSETQTVTGTSKTVTIDGTDHTNTLFEAEIDGVKYRMCPARMDEETGEIVWELAPVGIIENGYTYELTLDVWPNQLAFDMVADLNNGVKTKEEIKADIIRDKGQDVWDQIDAALVGPDGNGKYYVKTNWQEYVDYYTVDTEVDSEGHETTVYTPQDRKQLGPKDPVVLTSSEMDLRKIWEDTLDQAQLNELLWNEDGSSKEYSVTLHIWKADSIESLNNLVDAGADNTWYHTKTLGWNSETNQYDSFAIDDVTGQRFWEKTLDVAPGTMIELTKARDEMGIDIEGLKQVTYGSKTYVVLESGHYYTVTEDSIDRHFELNTIVYHPMLVDGVLSNVTFKADGSVETIVPMSTVDATNTLKGGINVQKKVFDGEGHEVTEVIVSDDTFKVRIAMNNADGTPYENWDYRIYYGQNNPNGEWDEANQNYGRTGHIYGSDSPGNGGVIETDLYIGDVIRIVNVPAGVTYSVQETEYDDTVYTLGSNYTFPLTTGGEEKSFTTDGNGISYMISKGENDNFVADSDKKVVGNAASQAVVVNKVPTARIKLLKVGDTTTPLGGVQFKIFYDEECTKPVTKDATGQAIPGMNSNGIITTDSEGYADLGTLAGTYYFQEVATKDGYNILTAPVRVNVEKDGDGEKVTASSTQEGVIFNTPGWIAKGEDGIWVVKVNNSTGVELPMTGGPGTLLYTLSGIVLMLGAAMMYGFRMRRRERRLN